MSRIIDVCGGDRLNEVIPLNDIQRSTLMLLFYAMAENRRLSALSDYLKHHRISKRERDFMIAGIRESAKNAKEDFRRITEASVNRIAERAYLEDDYARLLLLKEMLNAGECDDDNKENVRQGSTEPLIADSVSSVIENLMVSVEEKVESGTLDTNSELFLRMCRIMSYGLECGVWIE